MAQQAIRMRGLIDRELRRARLAGEGHPGRRFRPSEDIADLISGIQTLYEDRTLEVSSVIDTPEQVPFDQEDMLELLGNLLDNAAKWAQQRICLRLACAGNLWLRLEDDGPGVEQDTADNFLNRGARLDESIPGHGLGLSIVQEIVRVHGGRISFGRSQTLGGFAASVELPGPHQAPLRQ